jgi:GNAT superfamily N-acetyltransferase
MASYAFRITGIAPADSEWHAAGDDVHRSFWRRVVELVLVQKDRELAAGLDRHGRKMFRISAATRRRGRWRSHTGQGTADNPPLDPANELSRTRSLFTGRAHVDHAEFYWKYDEVSHQHWGRILGYHREGSERLPIRDVIGLSPASLGRVQKGANKWWTDWKRGHAMLAKVEQVEVVVPPIAGRPIPPRALPAKIDLSRFDFGIGGSEAALRRSIAAGSARGYRQRGETFRRSYETGLPIGPGAPPAPPPPPPKPPARPKPIPWVHPPRPIPGRPGRFPPIERIVPPVAAPKPPKPAPAPKPAETGPVTFGPSKAKVTVDAGTLRRLKELTGRTFTAQDVASLVGATHDAKVSATFSAFSNDITINITSKRYHSNRTIGKDYDGKPFIHNDLLVVEKKYRGAGLGAQVLGRQVEHASQWGFDRLETDAARSNGPDGYVGYYAWPRLGYNAPIPAGIKAKVAAAWPDAVTVRDLMDTQERRDWWKEHGIWTDGMIFRLQPGTESMNDLQANLQAARAAALAKKK